METSLRAADNDDDIVSPPRHCGGAVRAARASRPTYQISEEMGHIPDPTFPDRRYVELHITSISEGIEHDRTKRGSSGGQDQVPDHGHFRHAERPRQGGLGLG